MPLLETRELSVTFGGLRAVDGVSVNVDHGTVVGLIGPNGAGKTTFIDALTGFVPTSRGDIVFDGQSLVSLPAHQRSRAGLVRTWQSLELFDDLTVFENLRVAAERQRWWSPLADLVAPNRKRDLSGAQWPIDILGLQDLAGRLPTELSQGQRKLVGVARALAGRPKLVLMDEPAAGLDTAESQLLGRQIRSLIDHDITVFLVDHDMGLVLSICDYVYVIEFGQVIASGTPAEIRVDERVIAAYLGEQARREQQHDATAGQAVAEAGAQARESTS
ncbi:MAG: ABC transporter ATP-binding protein [Acidimicrobiales bacterium]